MDNVVADLSPDHVKAIEQATRDYYEGWFEGDPERLAKCLHPRLAKRNIDQPDRPDSPSMRTTGIRWSTARERAEARSIEALPLTSPSSTPPQTWPPSASKGGDTSTCFTSVDSETAGGS